MNLLVGCPVRNRAWILPDWFDHVEAAAERAGVTAGYVFALSTQDPSADVVLDQALRRRRAQMIVPTDDVEDLGADERHWNHDRFRHMTRVRNLLLDAVRLLAPDAFLSLDSDVLLHPDALGDLIESLLRFGAVGGATFMGPGRRLTSCGWVRGMNGLVRREMHQRGCIPVGVIMAIKLMSPAAYGVDYTFHTQGEDAGWSLAATEAGVRLGWDNRHISKHVMYPCQLQAVDERCGY